MVESATRAARDRFGRELIRSRLKKRARDSIPTAAGADLFTEPILAGDGLVRRAARRVVAGDGPVSCLMFVTYCRAGSGVDWDGVRRAA